MKTQAIDLKTFLLDSHLQQSKSTPTKVCLLFYTAEVIVVPQASVSGKELLLSRKCVSKIVKLKNVCGFDFLDWYNKNLAIMFINALNNLLVINFSHVKKYNVQNFTYRSHQPPHLPPSGFSNWNGKKNCYCGWEEEPAILMSRLLSHMHCMYIASICLDFTQNEWNAQNATWSHTFGPSLIIWSPMWNLHKAL